VYDGEKVGCIAWNEHLNMERIINTTLLLILVVQFILKVSESHFLMQHQCDTYR